MCLKHTFDHQWQFFESDNFEWGITLYVSTIFNNELCQHRFTKSLLCVPHDGRSLKI